MKPNKTSDSLLRIRAVAKQLDVSTRTVRRLIEKGELAYHRIGGSIRVTPADLERLLRNTREG